MRARSVKGLRIGMPARNIAIDNMPAGDFDKLWQRRAEQWFRDAGAEIVDDQPCRTPNTRLATYYIVAPAECVVQLGAL